MKRIPCDRECPNRHVGCHAKCEVYKAWKVEHEALTKKIKMQKMLDGQSDWMDDGKLYHDRTHVQERDNAAKRARYQDKKRRNNYAKKIRRIDETTP